MQNQLENKVYAGFFVRFVAFIIDSLIASLAVSIVKFPFSIAAIFGADFLNANFIFQYSFLDVLGYIGVAVYFVLLTYFTHTTPGKRIMRLEVITTNGEWTILNVLYRETIGRFFSSLLCVGYLVIFVQEKKQGFHDMLCDTFVVYKDMILQKSVVNGTFDTANIVSPTVNVTPSAMSVSPVAMDVESVETDIVSVESEIADNTISLRSAFEEPQIAPEQTEVTKSFDAMNPDCSNLVNLQEQSGE